MKIMLVDDDRTMRSILKTLLEIEKYTVSVWEGSTCEDILTKARTDCPDLMLLDVHIKDIDGTHVVRQLRQDPTLCNLKVLMTSGMELRNECLSAGANAFIMKPYMPDELISQLKFLISTN